MPVSQQIIVTFTGAIFAGIVLIALSKKIKVSAIGVLLLGGILLGPSRLGLGIINPGVLGHGFSIIIKLAVALILFEGGLTLDPKGYRDLSYEIRGVLTRGVIATWLLSALAIRLVFNFPWTFSILAGSLIIVTGPTVINPLLKRIGVKKNIHRFLHWEGVLIDPIGVFISLLCYEWIIGEYALLLFAARIALGVGFGILSGYILARIIKKQLVPEESLNVFILACALAVYVVSDLVIPESGLLSVTVSGFVVGYYETPQIGRLKLYKSQFVELLIGLLFMLLAANLEIDYIDREYVMKIGVVVLLVMFVIRPINIAASTFGKKNFNGRDRIFLSWIAPRGIVAASMASIFALNLKNRTLSQYSSYAGFLEIFTYSVIAATVIFQGFTAKWVGKLLGVLEPEPQGWLIVGAHAVARKIARFIMDRGIAVTLIDTNISNVNSSRKKGFTAIFGSALNVDADDFPELYGVGNIIALTKNVDLNELVCQRWAKKIKKARLYKWNPAGDEKNNTSENESSTQTVWHSLKLEKIISLGENELETMFQTGNTASVGIKHPERIILSHHHGMIYPYMQDFPGDDIEYLLFRPYEISIDLQLKPEWIIFSAATTLQQVIRELLLMLKNDYPGLDIDKIHSHLLKLESEYSSAIGQSVALPHTYIENINDSIVMVAKTVKPVKCRESSEDILFVFLVLSPKDQPDVHIQTLSEISKFIMNEDNHKKLIKASTRDELVQIFYPDLKR